MIYTKGKACYAPRYVIFEMMGDNTSLSISEETLESHDDMEDEAEIVRGYEADIPSILGDDDNSSCLLQYGGHYSIDIEASLIETMKVDHKIADFAINDDVRSTHEFSREEFNYDEMPKDSQVDCSIGKHFFTTTELDSNPSILGSGNSCIIISKIESEAGNIQLNYDISDTLTEDQSLRKDEFDQNNVHSDGDQEKDNIKGLMVYKISLNSSKFRSKSLAIEEEDSMKLNVKMQSEDNGHINRADIVVSKVPIKLRDKLQQKEVDVTADQGTLHVESLNTCSIIAQVNLLEPKIGNSIIESSVINEASEFREKPQSRGEFQQNRIDLEVEQENNDSDNQSGDKIISDTSQLFSKPVMDLRSTKMSTAERLHGLTVEKRNLLRGEIENKELSLSDTLNLLENPAPVSSNSVAVIATASSSRDEKSYGEPLRDNQSLQEFRDNQIHTNSTPLEDAQKVLALLELIKSKKKQKTSMKLSRDSETVSLVPEEVKREKNGCKPEKIGNSPKYTDNDRKDQNGDMTLANTLGSSGSSHRSSESTSRDKNFSSIYQADRNLENRSTEFYGDQENNPLASPKKIRSKELMKPENTTLNETIAANPVLLFPADHQYDTLKQDVEDKMEIQVNARANISTHREEGIRTYTVNSQLKNVFPASTQHRSTEELSDKANPISLANENSRARVIELRRIWKLMKEQKMRKILSWREAMIKEMKRRKAAYWHRRRYPNIRRNNKYLTNLEKRLTEITKKRQETLALKAEQDALAFKAEQDHLAKIKAKQKTLKNLRKVCLQLITPSIETPTGLTQSPTPQSSLTLDNKIMLADLQDEPQRKCYPKSQFSPPSSPIHCSLGEEKLQLIEEMKTMSEKLPNVKETRTEISKYTSTSNLGPPTAICPSTIEHVRERSAGETEESSSTHKYCAPKKKHSLEGVKINRRHSTGSISDYSSVAQLDEPKVRNRKRSFSRHDETNNSYFNEPPSKKSKTFVETSPNSSDVFNKFGKLRTGFITKDPEMMDNRDFQMKATTIPGNITPTSVRNRHRNEKIRKTGTRTFAEDTPLKPWRKTTSNAKKCTVFEVIDLTDD